MARAIEGLSRQRDMSLGHQSCDSSRATRNGRPGFVAELRRIGVKGWSNERVCKLSPGEGAADRL